MKATTLINQFPKLAEELNSIKESNKHRFIERMEKLIDSIKSAKLNGYTIEANRKRRQWSSCYLDHYLDKVEGLEEYLYENVVAEIEIGAPATIVLFSDTYGCQITSIKHNSKGFVKEVGVRKYEFSQKDWQDGECELKDTLYGAEEIFTLRRGGGWYAKGQEKSSHSVALAIGYARTYRDPSF